jgi:catechol 2,3-dioxygenase-like lactoylglutathione lyase family enzyme
MAIVGIQTLRYGVDDLAACTKYFEDFGLPLLSRSPTESVFELEEGSSVALRHISDPALPASGIQGVGVREVVWGVDTPAQLERLTADLQRDREVRRDADGTAHFLADDGIAFALSVFRKNTVVAAPDPVNAPGKVNRLNQHRKWRTRARPKTIQHVVFSSVDPQKSFEFARDRLGFRLTDISRGLGYFARCDGANDHHNIFWINANWPAPGLDGKVRFNHANFGVEDIDEIMVGANYMERAGWPKSHNGLGRHRIASALFYYLPCPAGGEAEYGADSDFLDDNWVPRVWDPAFGIAHFMHNLPPFLKEAPAWDVRFAEGYTPAGKA